jgi:hypothetical protein
MVDFFPTSRLGVVYITEPDLLTFSVHKKKLAKLRKVNRPGQAQKGKQTWPSSER